MKNLVPRYPRGVRSLPGDWQHERRPDERGCGFFCKVLTPCLVSFSYRFVNYPRPPPRAPSSLAALTGRRRKACLSNDGSDASSAGWHGSVMCRVYQDCNAQTDRVSREEMILPWNRRDIVRPQASPTSLYLHA